MLAPVSAVKEDICSKGEDLAEGTPCDAVGRSRLQSVRLVIRAAVVQSEAKNTAFYSVLCTLGCDLVCLTGPFGVHFSKANHPQDLRFGVSHWTHVLDHFLRKSPPGSAIWWVSFDPLFERPSIHLKPKLKPREHPKTPGINQPTHRPPIGFLLPPRQKVF